MATAAANFPRPVEAVPTSPSACASCGAAYPADRLARDAQKRIADLESQVRMLTEKATMAADKLADYEDELRRLKSNTKNPRPSLLNGLNTSSDTNLLASAEHSDPSTDPSAPAPATITTTSRLSGFLSRKALPAQPAGSPPSRPPSVREAELQEALQRELEARRRAETKVSQMSGEVEELSAQLFQQANEMVAAERKARARLEERVEVLERRDAEKRARLERLDGALKRIERVNGLLKGS